MLSVLYPPISDLSLFFSLQICLLAIPYVCCVWPLNLCFILSDFFHYLMLFFLVLSSLIWFPLSVHFLLVFQVIGGHVA